MKAAHEEVLELRRGDGGVQSASFPWSEEFHADLQAIHGPGGPSSASWPVDDLQVARESGRSPSAFS